MWITQAFPRKILAHSIYKNSHKRNSVLHSVQTGLTLDRSASAWNVLRGTNEPSYFSPSLSWLLPPTQLPEPRMLMWMTSWAAGQAVRSCRFYSSGFSAPVLCSGGPADFDSGSSLGPGGDREGARTGFDRRGSPAKHGPGGLVVTGELLSPFAGGARISSSIWLLPFTHRLLTPKLTMADPF